VTLNYLSPHDLYVLSLATDGVRLGILAVGGFSHGIHAGNVHDGRTGHAQAGHSSGAMGAHSPGSAADW